MITIKFPRGDYVRLLINNITEQLDSEDKLVMSLKKSVNDTEYIWQKELGNGIEWNEDLERYTIEINNIDTRNLNMGGKYVFDIVIVYSGTKPRTTLGNIILGKEVTTNEVEE